MLHQEISAGIDDQVRHDWHHRHKNRKIKINLSGPLSLVFGGTADQHLAS
jgi:hypothetical protein